MNFLIQQLQTLGVGDGLHEDALFIQFLINGPEKVDFLNVINDDKVFGKSHTCHFDTSKSKKNYLHQFITYIYVYFVIYC